MAIIQGANDPLILEFDESVEHITGASIGLYDLCGTELKHWPFRDITIDENKIGCPLTQEETSKFHKGWANVLVKLLKDGNIIFYEQQAIEIVSRPDKEYVL